MASSQSVADFGDRQVSNSVGILGAEVHDLGLIIGHLVVIAGLLRVESVNISNLDILLSLFQIGVNSNIVTIIGAGSGSGDILHNDLGIGVALGNNLLLSIGDLNELGSVLVPHIVKATNSRPIGIVAALDNGGQLLIGVVPGLSSSNGIAVCSSGNVGLVGDGIRRESGGAQCQSHDHGQHSCNDLLHVCFLHKNLFVSSLASPLSPAVYNVNIIML